MSCVDCTIEDCADCTAKLEPTFSETWDEIFTLMRLLREMEDLDDKDKQWEEVHRINYQLWAVGRAFHDDIEEPLEFHHDNIEEPLEED